MILFVNSLLFDFLWALLASRIKFAIIKNENDAVYEWRYGVGLEEADSFLPNGIFISTITENYLSGLNPKFDFNIHSAGLIVPQYLIIDEGRFSNLYDDSLSVEVIQKLSGLEISCNCTATNKLCDHQLHILYSIIKREEFRVFFDKNLRLGKIRARAIDFGMENDPDLDRFFFIEYYNKKLIIKPTMTALLPVTTESLNAITGLLSTSQPPLPVKSNNTDTHKIVVLKQHKYYNHLFIETYEASTGKNGKIKNPLNRLNPLDFIWETEDAQEIKFLTALSKFQNQVDSNTTQTALNSLKAIIKNPLGYLFYIHCNEVSDSINTASVRYVQLSKTLVREMVLIAENKGQFVEISGTLVINGEIYNVSEIVIKYTYFVQLGNVLFLIDSLNTLDVINFLKRKSNHPLIHQSKFNEFKDRILSRFEENIEIRYNHIPKATPLQVNAQGFNSPNEKIIFLSDFGQHVMLIPVIRYGEVEIPIRSKKQIHGADSTGKDFIISRNEESELHFLSLLLKQHPYFGEQLDNSLTYFYLHKKHFLNEKWFLNIYQEWNDQNITVLGFTEIEGNKLNPNKAKISIHVLSGQNWFNSVVKVSFGQTKASLKQIRRAIKTKNSYVQLDDGTLGILPEEWIERFSNYFLAGEIIDDQTIRTSKVNFHSVETLYEKEFLSPDTWKEIRLLQLKLSAFEEIPPVEVPKELKTTLRTYQKEGLNWLNFLDNLNFGGCLADDMGLGKTIQIIAFILHLRTKVSRNTNLLVVPTSVLFNWQAEFLTFSPSLRVLPLFGANRLKTTDSFDSFDVVLTTYGSLLTDINFLKNYLFNYVFLDESQNIKNVDSQRYKAVKSLQSRNKIVISGTPIENNTFDLYGQLSFACPGLLGSRQYFKDIYSSPIDKFKVSTRTKELRNKIKPFILRRTKQQVADELPEKTEMILYCEMKSDQRKVYNAYEREFREYISAINNEELPKNSVHVLKGLTTLRLICDSPLLLKGEKFKGDSSCKIEMLLEQIESKAARHKILVFSQFVGMLNLLKNELDSRSIGYSYLTGSTTNRETEVANFQNDPQTRVFLISLKAGGLGLNLTAADYVYLIDPWWNPSVENQAIDRCYRIGQKKNVIAIRLICRDTLEEKIMVMQQSKTDLVNNLLKTDQPDEPKLTKSDLLNLLGSFI